MRNLADRALLALKILIDIIFILCMAGVAIIGAGFIFGIVARVFMWSYNLIAL